MSFLKNLFGGGGSKDGGAAASKPLAEDSYKGFVIRAVSMPAGREYQLAGEISKEVGGETKTYNFVRADRFGSADEAASIALAKGRQIIDEQGDGVFTQTWPRPSA